MDLSKLATAEKAEKGARLYFKSPQDGKELTTFMEVLGTDSKTYIDRTNQLVIESVNRRKKDEDKDEVDLTDLKQGQDKQEETMLMMIVGWGDHVGEDKESDVKNTITWGTDEMKFTRTNLIKVLNACPWMKEQINKFMGNRANFLPA